MYELLDENDVVQEGDVIVFGDGNEWIVDGLAGEPVNSISNWGEWGDEAMEYLGKCITVAVLRPPSK